MPSNYPLSDRLTSWLAGAVFLAAALLVLAGLGGTGLWAQQQQRLRPLRIPPNLLLQLRSQGDRFELAGRERASASGQIVDARRSSQSVQLTRDIRGRFRLQAGNRVLFFDGSQSGSSGVGGQSDDSGLAESLADDSVEQFFVAVHRGDAVRLLGRRYRTDDGSAAAYTGPWHDIYELYWRGRDGQADSTQLKQFYFDSQTGYLARVRYPSSAGSVETRLSNWRQVNGQALAGRIERIVAGVTRWTFTASTLTLGADQNDSLFSGNP